MDVARIGGDDQARSQRLPGHIGDVHQRSGSLVRGSRRGCQGGRTRSEERGTDRTAGLSVARGGVRGRHAGPRFTLSRAARPNLASTPRRCLQGVLDSNEVHKNWVREHIEQLLAGIEKPSVAILGLTYKPGTSTLRRSSAIELCRWLHERGRACAWPRSSRGFLAAGIASRAGTDLGTARRARRAHLAVIATEWPGFRGLTPADVNTRMRQPMSSIRTIFSPMYWVMIPASTISPPASAPPDRMEGDDMALRGRSAIITGANQGLGFAIARRFVEAGANVLLAARGAERLHQAEAALKQHVRPGQIVASQVGDVSRPEDCQAIVSKARETMPGLMILVNNAGVYGPIGRIEDNDWDEWVQALQINLFGTVLMCRAVLPHLRSTATAKSSTCPAAERRRRCRASVPTRHPRPPWCASPRRWPRKCANITSTSTPSRRAR